MPPFRLPFTSRKGPVVNGTEVGDENARPTSHDSNNTRSPYSSKPSLALGVKEKKIEPNEFKLSSVDSEGQYLPPSPSEKQTFWGKTTKTPSNGSNHRSLIVDNEPFSISRESFDSYRRSFDISGRSPILHADSYTSRTSLDSRTFQLSRPSLNGNTFDRPEPVRDDSFDDVKLNDEATKSQPKKKSFLSRFSESSNEPTSESKDGKHHFHFPGRKRGQSGSGSELGEVKRPDSGGQQKSDVTVS